MNALPEIVLRAEGISKVFGGTVALNDVDFNAYRGKVNALVGENGAGKSTLMGILAGVHQPTAGRIVLDGEPGAHPVAARCRRARYSPDPPGAAALPEPERRREHLRGHRASIADRSSVARAGARSCASAGAARPARESARSPGRSGGRGPADGRDLQGALATGASADHGRAHLGALDARGRESLPSRSRTRGRGRVRRLHLASARGDHRARRLRHGAPRWEADCGGTGSGDRLALDRRADDRSRPEGTLPVRVEAGWGAAARGSRSDAPATRRRPLARPCLVLSRCGRDRRHLRADGRRPDRAAAEPARRTA